MAVVQATQRVVLCYSSPSRLIELRKDFFLKDHIKKKKEYEVEAVRGLKNLK